MKQKIIYESHLESCKSIKSPYFRIFSSFYVFYADLTQKLKFDQEYVVTHWREVAI